MLDPVLPDAGRSAGAHALHPIFEPRSVAVIGASDNPTKRGYQAVRALRQAGYRGRIIPVHPAGGELAGLPVVRGPAELTEPVDLILICTPGATVPGVLEEWAAAGARGAVVLAAGFAESGAEGATLESAVLDVTRRTGIRVVGPNTSGILNPWIGLNLIGMPDVRPGPLALLVQSGNVALQIITEASARSRLGFSTVVGVGNNTDIRFREYLGYFAQDERTRCILMHVEGFRDGRGFLEAARRVVEHKPVVVLKGARTALGGRAARSHTGAIAGAYDVLQAGLRQAGVLEVVRVDQLFHVGETLASQPVPRPDQGFAILSDGGGHATLAMDALQDRGVALAGLAPTTRGRLRDLLGPRAALDNPVDLAGAADGDPMVMARAMAILATDPAVGGVLLVGLFGGYAIRFSDTLLEGENHAARTMASAAAAANVALIVHTLYANRVSEPLDILKESGIPVIESLDVACACLDGLVRRSRGLVQLPDRPNAWLASAMAIPGRESMPEPTAIRAAREEGRTTLLETEARALLEAAGAPLIPAIMCTTEAEARSAARSLGDRVAVRIVSTAAPHKTDAGGVILGVTGDDEVAAAFRLVTSEVRKYAEARGVPADIRGVLVSPMARRPISEMLVGVVRDPQFGPVLTVGAGGIAVEVLRDVSLRVLPVAAREVDEMLDELRMGPILRGVRGRPPVYRDGIIAAALAVAGAALANPALREIEVNPLFVDGDRVLMLDTRAYLFPPAAEE